MTAARKVHVGWSAHAELPNTYRLYAECRDEITELILLNPTDELRAVLLVDADAFAASPTAAGLLAEHEDRCASCRLWRLAA